MPREPKWTNETTKRLAQGLLKLCQPAAKRGDPEPIDWPQVIKWLEAERDAAIRKLEKAGKGRQSKGARRKLFPTRGSQNGGRARTRR
jgi:hypothetical protein